MGKIGNNTFRDWNNGETMGEADYEQEREIFRTAINDNYDRLIKKFEVLKTDGTLETTQNLDTAINYLKFKETSTIALVLDNTSSTLTMSVIDGSITTAKLANLGVTTAKIADLNVTTGKLADGAVNLQKIDTISLDTRYYTETEIDTFLADLEGTGRTTETIKGNADNLTTHKTATTLDHPDGSVTTTKVADRNITRKKIALGAVGADELDPNLSQDVELNQHKQKSVLDHPDLSVTKPKLESAVQTTLDNSTAHIADNTVHVTQAFKDEIEATNNNQNRMLAQFNAIHDINGRAMPNSGTYYDLMDGTNDLSDGIIDLTETTATEALTTSDATNLYLPSHGLASNDMIVNATRTNANRIVTKVDANYVTVSSVTDQTKGDTIKKYSRGTDATAETGTTSTNITITSHGLAVGDYIINATRANALRIVKTVVDANNVTVDAVTNQASTDTIQRYNWFADDIAEGLKVLEGVLNQTQMNRITTPSKSTQFSVGQEVTVLDDTNREDVTITRAESNHNTVTYTVSDATVVSSAYTTDKDARPQVLDNGWHIESALDTSNSILYLYVSKDDGATFSELVSVSASNMDNFSVVSKGNVVYYLLGRSTTGWVSFGSYDAENNTGGGYSTLDSQDSIDTCSLAISPDKTTLLASFATKNGTYPNSFNIRAVLGTINSDNTVSWGTVEQLTTLNTTGSDVKNPSGVIRSANNYPFVVYDWNNGTTNNEILYRDYDSTGWLIPNQAGTSVYTNNGYTQSSPDLVTDKNGVLLCAWHGKDSTDTTANNVRYSTSSDGGATWTTAVKITSGNTEYNQRASITVDKNNVYYILFDGHDSAISSSVVNIKSVKNDGTGWTSPVTLTSGTTNHTRDASTFYDNAFSLDFSEALVIYHEETVNVRFTGTWNVIKEQFYLECTALANSYKKDAEISRSPGVNYNTTKNRLEFGGWHTTATNTVTDATVVASAYDTSGNGGRKTTRLSNGWVIAVAKATDYLYFYVSKDGGATFNPLCHLYNSSLNSSDTSILSKGNIIYVIYTRINAEVWCQHIDAETVSNKNVYGVNQTSLDSGQDAVGNVTLTTDGSKLYGSAATKNATYPNSYNIRYYEAPINSDGSVGTWSTTQLSTANTTGVDFKNPSITLNSSDNPVVLHDYRDTSVSPSIDGIGSYYYDGTGWVGSANYVDVYRNDGYAQSSPSAIFVPSTYSQSGKDEIHVSWMGGDSSQTNYNIRHAVSTDGGSNWTVSKITSFTSDHHYPSITFDKNKTTHIVFQGWEGSYIQVKKMFNDGTGWSTPTQVTSNTAGHAQEPSTLFDNTFNLDFSEPLFIYKDNDPAKVGFYGTWTVPKVVPLTLNTIRYNITPPSGTTDEIVAWIEREKQETQLSGTVEVTSTALSTVTGTSTLFTTELAVGDVIQIGDEMREVATISSNTSLTVASAFGSAKSAGSYAYSQDFWLDGYASIVDTASSESYVAMSKTVADISTTLEEDQFTMPAQTANERVTLKLSMKRSATTVSKATTKLLGAIG